LVESVSWSPRIRGLTRRAQPRAVLEEKPMARQRFYAVRWNPPKPARPVPRRSDPRTLPPLRLIPLPGAGPEHVAVDRCGDIVAGLDDGRIVSVPPDATDAAHARVLADTGGRPLGIERYGDDGAFLVCDAERGLLRVQPGRRPDIEVLCDTVLGEPLKLCSNAAVARDGTVYFTISSRRYDLARYKTALLEHIGTGWLMRYKDGEVERVLDDLQFGNGVVLPPDENSLVIAETGAYRLTRLQLTGPDQRKTSLIDALPGFPDNLTITADGLIWVGMVSPRDPLLDWLLPRSQNLRGLVSLVPQRLLPGPKDLAWALAVDQDGRVVHDLRGWRTGTRAVTAVRQHGNRLYLGSLSESAVAVVDLPQ
jgi:sugar lactone lactonase YvrE